MQMQRTSKRLIALLILGVVLSVQIAEAKDVQPFPLQTAKPIYPPDLGRAGVDGNVTVEFVIDTHGDVAEAHISAESESSPWQFKYAAVVAVWQWKFKPGLKDDVPVNVRMSVPMVFDHTRR